MKVKNKIGFHCGPGGNPSGIGAWMRTLNDAGIPFFLKSVDHFGMLHEAATQIGEWGADHTLVYRLSTAGQNDGFDYDVPDYHMQPEASADRHYDRTVSKLPPEMNRALVWHEPVNEVRYEIDPGDPMWGSLHPGEWFGRFGIQYATRCLLDNMRCALFAYASGNPERDGWQQPSMLNYLRLCAQHPAQVGIALHEYSYNVNNILDGAPDLIGRFRLLFDVCDSHGIARPTVLITEWGWTLNDVPGDVSTAVDDIDTVMQDFYAGHPQIKGAAIWYLGGGFGGIANKTQRLIAPMTEFTLETEYEVDIEPPPPATPPPTPSANLVRNWSFELGWQDIITGYGSLVNQRPSEWDIRWLLPGDTSWELNAKTGTVPTITTVPECLHKPCHTLPPEECAGGSRPLILEGTHTYKLFAANGIWGARLKQVYDGLPPNVPVRATVPVNVHYQNALNEPDDVEIAILLNTAKHRFLAMPDLPDRTWVYLTAEGMSDANGRVELRIRAYNKWPNSRDVFIDAIRLELVQTPCPGQAREPYNRVYFVVPGDVTSAQKEAIYLQAALENRTVGPSYDDAGIGDGLTSKTAVLWEIPTDEQPTFITWYAHHYSGTAVTFRHLHPGTLAFTYWPTDWYAVNQYFGENPEDYLPFGLPGHEGWDIKAPHGSPVRAVAAGVVYMADYPPGHNYGRQVRIDHGNGWKTIYAHLLDTAVSNGQQVQAGQLLGLADNTGNSSGSHLHLTLKRDGHPYTDPQGSAWPHFIQDPTPFLQPLLDTPAAPAGDLVDGWLWHTGLSHKSSGTAVLTTNLNLRAQAHSGSQLLRVVERGEVAIITGQPTNHYYPARVKRGSAGGGGGQTYVTPAVGVHNEDGAGWMLANNVTGYTVHTVALGPNATRLDMTRFANQGINVLVRLNWGYHPDGTIPDPDNHLHVNQFVSACLGTIAQSMGVFGWIIGNEVNNPAEWPHGRRVTPEAYATIYNQIWHGAAADHRIAPLATDPYYGPGSDNRDWWVRMLNAISGADFLTIHPKTQDSNPQNCWSDARFSNEPLTWQYLHLKSFIPLLEAVPTAFRHLPVYATEVNPQRKLDGVTLGWEASTGAAWVREAMGVLDWWNRQQGQQIHAAIFYRYTGDAWEIFNKPAILQAIREG